MNQYQSHLSASRHYIIVMFIVMFSYAVQHIDLAPLKEHGVSQPRKPFPHKMAMVTSTQQLIKQTKQFMVPVKC